MHSLRSVSQADIGANSTQLSTDNYRVAFAGVSLSNVINSAGWEIWSTSTPNTANADFIEFNNSGEYCECHPTQEVFSCVYMPRSLGAGASGTRPSWTHKATSDSGLDIASILGSGYTSWVDTSYLT